MARGRRGVARRHDDPPPTVCGYLRAAASLGAPGPENLLSPINRNSQFGIALLDSSVSSSSSPNRVRDLTSDPVNNSMLRSNPARPIALQRMFKRLRFADAAIRSADHVFDKLVDSLPRVWVSFLPGEIFLP